MKSLAFSAKFCPLLAQREFGFGRRRRGAATPAPLLGALFVVLAACGAAPNPASPANVPPENAASAAAPATAPGAATPSGAAPSGAANEPPDSPSTLPEPAPSQPVVAPAPSAPAVTPVPAQCRGSSIDLETVLSNEACMVGADFVMPVTALDCMLVSVEPEKPIVNSGAWATLRVIFENPFDTPCSLVFRFWPSYSLGFLGEPTPRTTGGFRTRSFLGDANLDDPPGPVVLGALLAENRDRVQVEIEPRGRAVGIVNWQAVGFVPGEHYRPKRDASGGQAWVPEPLPRGTYTLVISTPLEGPGGQRVTTTVLVEVTR